MNLKRHIVFITTLLSFSVSAQNTSFHFPQKDINKFNSEALQRVRSGETAPAFQRSSDRIIPAAGIVLKYRETRPLIRNIALNKAKSYVIADTLFIGDTLEISGEWLRDGPIVIYNSGLLHFSRASATILGDIYLFGEHSQLIADSSSLYIPQTYFYQRIVFATGGSKVAYHNTTVDHSGLSHNIILVDSAKLELINVTNKGFTTNGIYDRSSVYVNRINEAGEYILMDESKLEFYNAKTVLLWHQFPESAIVDFSFPEGDTVDNYQFNNSIPGIAGINYSVTVSNCTNVMWGMMPATGSHITISDSKIRSIGLWFMGSDTVNVSGLVDNSTYSDFEPPLSDRTLSLKNCTVTTWSIYPMEHSYVNLTECIVGEIGTGGRSSILGNQFFCDGSGGYVWSSDSSFLLGGFSYTSGFVRSQANSILLYAYSALSGGYPSALQNSVIMVLQCTLPEEPRIFDNSVAWYALIGGPGDAVAGDIVPVSGSAWIDKTATSNMMDFGSYRLYYQLNESDAWTEIPVDSLNEKRNETLGIWNTTGLPAGQYLLRLVIKDNWGNTAEALKTISLQPSFGISEPVRNCLLIYPNPSNDMITIMLPEGFKNILITISDLSGRVCLEKEFSSYQNCDELQINLDSLQSGYYLVSVSSDDRIYQSKLIFKSPN
jgi:hypothetical protein